jgi:hypothetical protein
MLLSPLRLIFSLGNAKEIGTREAKPISYCKCTNGRGFVNHSVHEGLTIPFMSGNQNADIVDNRICNLDTLRAHEAPSICGTGMVYGVTGRASTAQITSPSLEAGRPRGQPVRAALQVRDLEIALLVGQHLAFRVGLQVKHLDIRVDYDGA